MLNPAEVHNWIANGENSGLEFKQDHVRPEQIAKELVAFLNLKGGCLVLGVDDDGSITGLTRANAEEWVMNICAHQIHPRVIPYYEECVLEGKRIAMITVDMGIAKPYVVRHAERESVYIRVGSTSRLATREDQMRLFQEGGFLHVETLPVSGADWTRLDMRRIYDYFTRIRKLDPLPQNDAEWIELLVNLEYLTRQRDQILCTIAGLVLFGRKPRQFLPQAGLEWIVFPGLDKEYDTRDRMTIDGPLVGLWDANGEHIEDGVVEGLWVRRAYRHGRTQQDYFRDAKTQWHGAGFYSG